MTLKKSISNQKIIYTPIIDDQEKGLREFHNPAGIKVATECREFVDLKARNGDYPCFGYYDGDSSLIMNINAIWEIDGILVKFKIINQLEDGSYELQLMEV